MSVSIPLNKVPFPSFQRGREICWISLAEVKCSRSRHQTKPSIFILTVQQLNNSNIVHKREKQQGWVEVSGCLDYKHYCRSISLFVLERQSSGWMLVIRQSCVSSIQAADNAWYIISCVYITLNVIYTQDISAQSEAFDHHLPLMIRPNLKIQITLVSEVKRKVCKSGTTKVYKSLFPINPEGNENKG